MKKRKVGYLVLSLLLGMSILLSACGGNKPKVTVDENGLATWEAMEGATGYEIAFVYEVNGTPVNDGDEVIQATSVQIPEGFCLHIRAVYEDGSYSNTCTTDYYGEKYVVMEEQGEDGDEVYSPYIPHISVDENGLATWDPIEGAIAYEVLYIKNDNGMPLQVLAEVITETSARIPNGYCLHIRAVFEDENRMEGYATTEYFGEVTLSRSNNPYYNYDVDWEALSQWELVSNINLDSVEKKEDGSVWFEALGPGGEVMRFWGEDITISEAGITFGKDGRIMALDAIGRIYNAYVGISEPGNSENNVCVFGGYNFSGNKHADSIEEIMSSTGLARYTNSGIAEAGYEWYDLANFQPNYVGIGALPFNYPAGAGMNKDAFTLSTYTICYDDSSYHTGIRDMGLYFDDYGAHMEGQQYMVEKEGLYDLDAKVTPFALALVPDLQHELYPLTTEEAIINNAYSIEGSTGNRFRVGDLKDAEGNVLDKETAKVYDGTTLEVTLGQYTIDMALTVMPRFVGAQTMHDLVPYAFPEATGDLNTLVIPIAWQDDSPEVADTNYAYFRSALGRVADMGGNITDYSDEYEGRFSLSEYFDIASYGKLSINSYMTDWYQVPYTFEEMKDQNISEEFVNNTLDWLYATYPDTDWTRFDKDANGYFDAVIFVNAGETDNDDGFLIDSFGGGVLFRSTYTNSLAGTIERPGMNCYTNAHIGLISGNVLIHEFGHNLGLIDYYDVTYSGINAVGEYDMQSGSYGDWNAYSKFAAGWISPEIVTDLKSGESVEIEIGSMAVTGDAIVIPPADSAYDGSPFAEYMMVDLFTPEGTNLYDAEEFGLEDAVGVRIYHVNAEMEYREEKSDNIFDPITCPIGTVHVANEYKYDEFGYYHIEVLQSGGDNTFTDLNNLDTRFSEDDLFKAGDVFTAENYDEFLYEGRMDDGSVFGYEIKVVSIEPDANGEYKAVIRITRQ
ncbi:MAG: hypothetical protein J6B90_11585 [Lachnospiraceae bacterium]|nr:hypothetical protein [Lachnospiraceae bacterium]